MPSYDVFGDVHGCYDELLALLAELAYGIDEVGGRLRVVPPNGRTALFLGDLIDRGPRIPEVVTLVLDMVAAEAAVCLLGNHEHQLLLYFDGEAPIAWGLEQTLEQFEKRPEEELERLRRFSAGLPYRFDVDDGRLLLAHAGLPQALQGMDSPEARNFALCGHPTGTARLDWASDYRGTARVVYGHTPTEDPTWVSRTICIDTGCVYGGRLTALRYPELELVSVAAGRPYYRDQ